MKVLHVDTGREMRGGQWQVLHLLGAASHEATLLAPANSGLYHAAHAAGVAVLPLRLATLVRLAGSTDLVHAHDARAHTLAAFTAERRAVVSRRVAFAVKKGVASRWKYARAARYIAVSQYVRHRLLEAGIDESRVAVVYDGVPRAPLSTRLGPVIAPATDDARKGSALLREAARLAGVDVRFTNDMAAELQHARLLVYLSHAEGLGSAVLMAMAAGVPVIASRVGGLPEAVADGVTGLLVDNEPGPVAAALLHLLSDPLRAGAMGEAGRRRWEAEFTVARMVEQTESVYRDCVG